MPVGIERINLYGGRFAADAIQLANAAGLDTEKVMVAERSVIPPFEDAVTLAVNAAKRLLRPGDAKDIELLVVGSESGLDDSKALSTWVHRFLGLQPNCRSLEVKHACYGTTGALKLVTSWVATQCKPGKKALVISTDLTRADLTGTGYDFIGGGCAVAMLISHDPQVLEIEPGKAGYWTQDIYDTYRPTATHEVVHKETSLFSYLDALDGAFEHYEQVAGPVDYQADFKKHIYHAPFPGMTLQAHQSMLSRIGISGKAEIWKSFQEKVEGGICWSKRLGTAYGASCFVCLMGLLHSSPDLQPRDRISIFSYGSGCQGEFYEGLIGAGAPDNVRALAVDRHLDEREILSPELYRLVENARQGLIDCPDYVPEMEELKAGYERMYQGRKLLVLKSVKNFEREYGWS